MTGSDMSNEELKIVFAGTMGAGKTTAIRAISSSPTLSTEVPITGHVEGEKHETTVGFDHGVCELGEGMRLSLFGTPGQARFDYMWPVLSRNAFGLVVLADNRRPDPVADVQSYLRAFEPHFPTRRMVVGVGRTDTAGGPTIDDYCASLSKAGFDVPVLEVDVRRSEDVRLLLSVLVSMAEVEHG
jgi:uncharacterized protein